MSCSLSLKLKVFGFRSIMSLVHHTVVRFTTPREFTTLTIPIEPIPIRCIVFYPKCCDKEKCYPVYVHLHAGGFVGGYSDDESEYCTWLSNELHCIVVAPDYRLAPEDPYPSGLNDCVETIKWVRQNFCPSRVAVGGFSAGGTLALGAAQIFQSSDQPLDSVSAFYCPLDFSLNSKNTLFEKNPTQRSMFHEAYLLNVDHINLTDPLLSPAYAPAASLPDSIVMIGAGQDPSIRDMQDFIDRMKIEKTQGFTGRVFEGVFHGWNMHPESLLGEEKTQAKWDAYRMVADELARVFQS